MGNHRDWRASPFLERFEALLEAHSPGYHRDYRRIDFAGELAALPWVAATEIARHGWTRRLTRDDLSGLILSSSITQRAIAAIGATQFHAAVDAMIAAALDAEAQLEFPYVSEIHLARKR